jgi:hypothetical protein
MVSGEVETALAQCSIPGSAADGGVVDVELPSP